MAKRRVFISFDYDNDRHYKNLLVAWDQNKQFDLRVGAKIDSIFHHMGSMV